MNDLQPRMPLPAVPQGERLRLLISQRWLQERIVDLARQIDADYHGRTLSLIAVLKGSFIFAADLMRQIGVPTTIDFVGAASYGASARSSGTVALSGFERLDLRGRDVLVIEDILDTGRTLSVILDRLAQDAPASLALCTLLRKPAGAALDLPVPYVGFDIPNEFVVGYGLDYAEHYRNLRGIYRLSLV